jgi:hypothetical protein
MDHYDGDISFRTCKIKQAKRSQIRYDPVKSALTGHLASTPKARSDSAPAPFHSVTARCRAPTSLHVF